MTEPIFPRNRVAALAVLLIPLAAAACNGDQQSSGRRPATPSSTVPSFGPAYGLIGDHASRTRDITSAGIAVIPNTEVSRYVDRFEQDLRTKTAGTGISLARNGKELVD